MLIEKKIEDGKAVLCISGRIDTTTAPALECEVNTITASVNELVFDFSALEYISSAGLRVILKAHKTMASKGTMKLTGVNEDVMSVFEITGFSGILNIE